MARTWAMIGTLVIEPGLASARLASNSRLVMFLAHDLFRLHVAVATEQHGTGYWL